MTLTQLFTNIANAIRAKTGSSSTIIASNFPTEITNIELGYEKSEGENLNLKNSANAQLAKLNINGNSVQDGTPTPSNQVPINSAGDNINLFDKTANITRGYTYTSTGGTTQLNNCFIQEKYIEVESSKEYILSTTNSYISETDYRLVICEYDSSKNFIKRNLSSTQYYKITTSATTKYVRLCASTVTIDELKFEKGSIATPYSPYGMGSINEVISNKNLCNGINQNYFINANATSTGVASGNSGLLIKTDGISSYTISTKVLQTRFRAGVSENIPTSVRGITLYNGQAKDGTNNSITINSNGYDYLIVNATDLTNIQIEKGSSATTFVPHQEQNISIPCQQPMRSIGNARDGFVKIDGVWYEKHNIGQVVLNGSENWEVYSGASNIFFSNISSLPLPKNANLNVFCNYYTSTLSTNSAATFVSETTGLNYAIGTHVTAPIVRIKDIRYTTPSELSSWLSTHNTEVIYQLAEPIYLECTEEQITALEQARTYKPVTHISSADVVPAYLDLVYYKKI